MFPNKESMGLNFEPLNRFISGSFQLALPLLPSPPVATGAPHPLPASSQSPPPPSLPLSAWAAGQSTRGAGGYGALRPRAPGGLTGWIPSWRGWSEAAPASAAAPRAMAGDGTWRSRRASSHPAPALLASLSGQIWPHDKAAWWHLAWPASLRSAIDSGRRLGPAAASLVAGGGTSGCRRWQATLLGFG
jgi:hypothetical protein